MQVSSYRVRTDLNIRRPFLGRQQTSTNIATNGHDVEYVGYTLVWSIGCSDASSETLIGGIALSSARFGGSSSKRNSVLAALTYAESH
jgi:hypothetical protein